MERWQTETNETEARVTLAELIRCRDRHAFYCAFCLDSSTCTVSKVYDDAITACVAIIDAAKVANPNA